MSHPDSSKEYQVECDDCKAKFDREDMHHDESGSYCEPCYEAAFKQGALDAGIPLSVIEGKTKLTDHFSQDYIDHMCNKKKD